MPAKKRDANDKEAYLKPSPDISGAIGSRTKPAMRPHSQKKRCMCGFHSAKAKKHKGKKYYRKTRR